MFVFGSSLSLVEARGLKRNASAVESSNEDSEDDSLDETSLINLDPEDADGQTNCDYFESADGRGVG